VVHIHRHGQVGLPLIGDVQIVGLAGTTNWHWQR
jgi:hypothetical protein